jgi:hypothetical protein
LSSGKNYVIKSMSQVSNRSGSAVKVRVKVEKIVQQKYDKAYFDKYPERQQLKRDLSKLRAQRMNFFAKFGMKCVEVGLHKKVLESVTDSGIIDAVNKYASSLCTNETAISEGNMQLLAHSQRTSARLKTAKRLIQSKVPVRYVEDATQCEYCEETCGPNSCSAECVFYSEQRMCNHTNEYY